LKSGDIIENKGRGLTIVLHGPPGVGKTLTAECIAEYAKKPIIPLSVGNLVAVQDSIEERLTEAFANATRLGAILLLDEADVVLEARSLEDVRRNGIVSG
jgi:AAA+ superfamily predicted ATPase